jgi:hypothetical protein
MTVSHILQKKTPMFLCSQDITQIAVDTKTSACKM